MKRKILRLKTIQLELHEDFIKVVEKSRGSKLKDPEKNNIFTGEFWTGKTSLKLGLIDGLGNADQVLKEKFGDNVVIKTFEKPKGFLARKLSSSIQDPVEKLANIIEEKSLWQKFGCKCRQKKKKKTRKHYFFSDIIMSLQKFWCKNDCVILQYVTEVALFSFTTTLRSLGQNHGELLMFNHQEDLQTEGMVKIPIVTTLLSISSNY